MKKLMHEPNSQTGAGVTWTFSQFSEQWLHSFELNQLAVFHPEFTSMLHPIPLTKTQLTVSHMSSEEDIGSRLHHVLLSHPCSLDFPSRLCHLVHLFVLCHQFLLLDPEVPPMSPLRPLSPISALSPLSPCGPGSPISPTRPCSPFTPSLPCIP